jgi:hypothetical protein
MGLSLQFAYKGALGRPLGDDAPAVPPNVPDVPVVPPAPVMPQAPAPLPLVPQAPSVQRQMQHHHHDRPVFAYEMTQQQQQLVFQLCISRDDAQMVCTFLAILMLVILLNSRKA